MPFLCSTFRFAVLTLLLTAGAIALGARTAAALEFDIIDPTSGTRLGGIAFPAPVGSEPAGVTFELEGYTEAHITSIEWALDPQGGLGSLNVEVFQGDDPCEFAHLHGPCQNVTGSIDTTTAEAVFESGGISCPPPPPPGHFTFCTILLGILDIELVPSAPAYACVGFAPPLDGGPVTVKKNRVLPFKAELVDAFGFALTDQDLTAAPVLQILFASGVNEEPEDVTAEALPAGLGMTGNAFVFRGSKWRFNLKTRNYTAPGTYTASMVTGNGSEYGLAQTCTAQFVAK